MNKRNLQNILGVYLILSHCAVIILVFVLFVPMNDFSQLTTTLGLIIPMFSVYTSTIVRFIIKNMENSNLSNQNVSKMFVFISFLIPTIFVIYLTSIIFLKAYNYAFSNFDHFQVIIGSSETLFGVYIGQIIVNLYENK